MKSLFTIVTVRLGSPFFLGLLLAAIGLMSMTLPSQAGCRVEVRNGGKMVVWADFGFTTKQFKPSGYKPADNAPSVRNLLKSYRFSDLKGASEGCRMIAKAGLHETKKQTAADVAVYELKGCFVKLKGPKGDKLRAQAKQYCGIEASVR
ncbi:hypothetical protein G6N74_30435 [Mesorhizobium sp. CGMCC 1.15528]|uniref:Uncharacterized protein n=2 Tax=Mesorhizobium zhangyense TaxID=1776730 RepID=A0A7C9RC10_9HYPH|nr:hypothetical protein [Mesorhizobium zhangyense]